MSRAMLKAMGLLASACLSSAASATSNASASGPRIALVRVDCGRGTVPHSFYSDTYAYPAADKIDGVVSCYVVRHGDQYLLWDAGIGRAYLPGGAGGMVGFQLNSTISEQLSKLGLDTSRINLLAISHLHFDHVGQAEHFPGATLIVAGSEWSNMKGSQPDSLGVRAALSPWLQGNGAIRLVDGDSDIFGDGSVVMLSAPGHTGGHHILLVRLTSGAVLLVGDLWHSEQQVRDGEVSQHTEDRAALLASRARALEIAKNLHARLIVSHDADDVGKLPRFPAWAH